MSSLLLLLADEEDDDDSIDVLVVLLVSALFVDFFRSYYLYQLSCFLLFLYPISI
jgi:hypothetical protein